MRTGDRAWDKADCARLAEMWVARVSGKDIAAALGRTERAIRRQHYKLQLPTREPVRPAVVHNGFAWPEEDVGLLRALWGNGDDGEIVAEIAKALGRSRNAVIGKAFRLGLRRITKEERDRRMAGETPPLQVKMGSSI